MIKNRRKRKKKEEKREKKKKKEEKGKKRNKGDFFLLNAALNQRFSSAEHELIWKQEISRKFNKYGF